MPLNTRIMRDGKPLSLKWADFHVAAMVIAASADSGQGPYKDMEAFVKEAEALMERQGSIGISISDAFSLCMYPVIGATPLNDKSYTLKKRWSFVDKTDGETFELLPGDELSAWRSYGK